jgi:putative sigma-54 modulation protein
MQVDITGHHVDVTDALKDYVHSKMERVKRHFDQLISVHVVLSVEKLRHQAEATIAVSGANLVAVAEDADMYAAIDAMTDKLDRQAIKIKEKKSNHR